MLHGLTGSVRRFAVEHPLLVAGGVAAAALVVVAAFVWFRPDKLFVDQVVDDAFPMASPTPQAEPAADGDQEEQPPEDAPEEGRDEPVGPIRSATGPFSSHNRYTTVGEATVYDLEDGGRIVRFENFETDNGPDLRVYLSAAPPGTQDRTLADDFVDLGPLRGNIGAQNYDLPPHVDLDRYRTVVIWCVRFTVSFGGAELMPVA